MANRPVFVSINKCPYYKQINVDFTFFSGFAVSQKQKSILSLHNSVKDMDSALNPLEISTKGLELVGVQLSAFNLQYLRKGKEYSIESIFQGSKVFELGGPYVDIYEKSPKEAKRDDRIRNSGRVIDFKLDGVSFSTEPKDYFYNWIYSTALYGHGELLNEIKGYNSFTDIEFNPEKSINCQARTVAIVKGMMDAGVLDEAMRSPESYLKIVYGEAESMGCKQLTLFDFQ